MTERTPASQPIRIPARSIVIVGMMGAGKSSVGRKLAARLAIPFVDADAEIEAAAGCTIEQIFERFGEAEFRKGERRVIARLLDNPMHVLSTGGGAFMDDETREVICTKSVSVWLKADIETLLARTARRNDRPLLKQGDPRDIMNDLLAQREPVYAQADVTIMSDDRPIDETVDRIISALADYAAQHADLDGYLAVS